MELLVEDADIVTMAPGSGTATDRPAACWSGMGGSRPSARPGRSARPPDRTHRWCGWTGPPCCPG